MAGCIKLFQSEQEETINSEIGIYECIFIAVLHDKDIQILSKYVYINWFGLVSLFNYISTLMRYLMSKNSSDTLQPIIGG